MQSKIIHELIEKTNSIIQKKDLVNKQIELNNLKEQASQDGFWNDINKAKLINQRISGIEKDLNIYNILNSLKSMLEIADTELSAEIDVELEKINKTINKLEFTTYLSGKYDQNGCIFSIFAGQGGTEACDWTQMLERMYLKYFQSKGYGIELIERIPGVDAGIDSVQYEITGDFAYGFLKHEMGTHRLVRISPFNAQGLRQTSFAGVEVVPIFDESADIIVNEADIDFAAVRSGGAGGQNVNKVATSVRITHRPSGITVSSSALRTQLANKKAAMDLLKGKLFLIEEAKRLNELKGVKGDYKIAGWGNQIRNYVLDPYKLIKDLRVDIETSDYMNVLNGNLDLFINELIKL